MTFEEYEMGYYGEDSGDIPQPPRDPQEQAMVDHLVEFETEMYRIDCNYKFSRMSYTELKTLMIDLHGEDWEDAL